MADAVTTIVLDTGSRRLYAARFTNISDATGESGATKVDISTLTGPNGNAPSSTSIMEVLWSMQGFSTVRIYWDHTTDDLAKILSGGGYADYSALGGLKDPKSAGGTGDILFTTTGAASGATYDITLVLELRD